jgi:hypothetical protein
LGIDFSAYLVDEDQVVSIADVEGIPDLNGKSFPIKRIYKKFSQKKTVTVEGETKEITEMREVLVTNRLRIDVPNAKQVCICLRNILMDISGKVLTKLVVF